MSRLLDMTKPLSEEDEQYLLARGQENVLRQHRQAMGQDPTILPGLTGNEPGRMTDVPAGIGVIAPGLSPAHAQLRADGENFSHVTTEQMEQELQRRYDAESAGAEPSEEDDSYGDKYLAETDDRPYEDWSKPQLVAQAKQRKLAVGGSKTDLVERLREDDESE